MTVTDAEDNVTVFESNLAGQRTAMTDPAAGTSAYTYDLNSQTTAVTSPAGTITMAYDELGRMTGRTSTVAGTGDPSSSATWDYVNTGVTALTEIPQLCSSKFPTLGRFRS